MNLRETFGDIDIYLFDQILKGRIPSGARILDAGCGGGRNLIWFLREGFDVSAVDSSPYAVEQVRALAGSLAPALSAEEINRKIRVAPVDSLPYPDHSFDFAISSAVLHFAEDEAHFNRMVREMWRVLKPEGLFFARLASTIGIEDEVQVIDNRRHLLPDGSERFLVDQELLLETTAQLGGRLADPLKTTVVQNMRSMTTWTAVKIQDAKGKIQN